MNGNFLIQYRYLIVFGLAFAVFGSIFLLPKLNVDVRFSTFFPAGDPDLDFHEFFSKKMGNNDPFIKVALKPEKRIFDSIFLQKTDSFTLALRRILGIKNVNGLTNLTYARKTPFGIIRRPYLDPYKTEKFAEDSLKIVKDKFLTERFYSPIEKTLLVFIELAQNLELNQADTLMMRIDSVIQSFDFHESHLLGRKYMEVEYKRMVTKELVRSMAWSFGFIILVLIFLYRSVQGVLLPLISMIFALLIFYGILALTGRSLGILANLFPTIMLIVGISDVIHLLTKYSLEIKENRSKKEAILKLFKETGLSIFLTSFTTAVGFLTLTTASMTAIQNFGFDAAIGVMIAFLVSILFVPSILFIFGFKSSQIHNILAEKLNQGFEKLHRFNLKSGSKILWFSGVIALMSILGMTQINTNTLQLTNIPNHHRLKIDFNFFEEKLGGGRIFEMAIFCKNKNGFELSELNEIQKLHDYLHHLPNLKNISSPITYYHGIAKVFEPRLQNLELPKTNEKLKRYLKIFEKKSQSLSWKLVDSTQMIGRVSASVHDLGRLRIKSLNSQINSWIIENLDTSKLEFRFTGSDLLIDKAHEHRIQNMGSGLLIAILMVAIIMGFLFRNFSIVIITLLVNILPLVIVAGLMGFLGIELRGTSSIIFTIGFVIAVDDTIHFLNKYRLELQKGHSVSNAIQITLRESGKAILLTSIILFGGFFTLIHSDFWDVYVHGILVSFMLLFALLTDLFLLPVLLLKFKKSQPKSLQ
jgi:predicted RND superfamily exporter protein